MTEEIRAQVQGYLAEARWFGGKGRSFEVTGVRRLGHLDPDGTEEPRVSIDLAEVTYADGDAETELYQLPLAFYAEAQDRLDHAFVGWWDDPELGRLHVYDAVHDRYAMQHWLSSFAAAAAAPHETGPGGLVFHRLDDDELDTDEHSTLFSGEQSNSSVFFGDAALLKLFRKVTPGANPDVEVHRVLTEAGSEHVAALRGWVEVSAGEEPLQLGMLSQFLRTASDGWDLAQASVRNLFAEADLHADEVGGDFAGEAARLGAALAQVHALLAEHFPSTTRDRSAMSELSAAMNTRLDDAFAVTAELEPHVERLRTIFEDVAYLDGVPTQRIHGDLHLGQTLRTVNGWKIVDFEGEPAKPLRERMLPDSPWRDVAGMLRSFDYAPRAAMTLLTDTTDEYTAQRTYRANEWAARNAEAFLQAYAGRELTDAEQALLDAYVADKAVYETVYEARNRPSWISIPLEAIARIGES